MKSFWTAQQLADIVRVSTYDLRPNIDRTFKNMESALTCMDKVGSKIFNVYKLVNGVWTTEY